ncbi:MAG: OstA-like protein [Balneolaceae bacterium]
MHRLLQILLLLPLLLWLPVCAEAQDQVELLQARSAEGGVINGEPVRKLIGEVRLASEQVTIEADSAWQYQNRNRIDAFNIQITTDQETIWADTLHYNTITEFSQFRGRVILHSGEHRLYSETVDVDRISNLTFFHSPVRFEDERGVLVAQTGSYNQARERGTFQGQVQLSDSTQYFEADTLRMDRLADQYELHGSVYAIDLEEEVTLTGTYLEADSTGRRLLEGDAWMMQLRQEGQDSTYLFADRILLLEQDTIQTLEATGQVRIWNPEWSAIADSLHYRSDRELFRLWSDPILWQERLQLTGPEIEAEFRNEQIHTLTAWPQPVAVMEVESIGRFHQVSGDSLVARFSDGEISQMDVIRQNDLIYQQQDEQGEPDGLIELTADGTLRLHFDAGELSRFRATENIDGSWHPESPSLSEQRLDRFQWNPERRPNQPGIQTPRFPPIPDELPFQPGERYRNALARDPDLSLDRPTNPNPEPSVRED